MTILHNGNGSANLSFLNQFDADDVQVGDVITLSIDGGTTYQVPRVVIEVFGNGYISLEKIKREA